jgi:uncharacterized protein YciI
MTKLFAMIGYLKADAEDRLIDYSVEVSEYLAQPARNIVVAGALRDHNRHRIGYMAFVEAESFEAANAYMRESPYYQAGLYERWEVLQYEVQIGRIELEQKGLWAES